MSCSVTDAWLLPKARLPTYPMITHAIYARPHRDLRVLLVPKDEDNPQYYPIKSHHFCISSSKTTISVGSSMMQEMKSLVWSCWIFREFCDFMRVIRRSSTGGFMRCKANVLVPISHSCLENFAAGDGRWPELDGLKGQFYRTLSEGWNSFFFPLSWGPTVVIHLMILMTGVFGDALWPTLSRDGSWNHQH
jgi:hypothetical protein